MTTTVEERVAQLEKDFDEVNGLAADYIGELQAEVRRLKDAVRELRVENRLWRARESDVMRLISKDHFMYRSRTGRRLRKECSCSGCNPTHGPVARLPEWQLPKTTPSSQRS